MRLIWKSLLGLVSMTVAAMMVAGCSTKFGGMSVQEAFPDERVAAMVQAASRGDWARMEAQIDAGADPSYIGTEGISPLIWLLGTLDFDAVERLLEAGADPNYVDEQGSMSAMYIVSGGNRPDLLRLLLRHGGDPNLLGPFGQPMLVVAVEQHRRENIDILLEHGADINGHNRFGITAVHTAALRVRYDLVAYLLERGADYNLEVLAQLVEQARVPADSEAQRGKERVIEMLKERGVSFPATRDPRDRH